MGLYKNQPTVVGCWVSPSDEKHYPHRLDPDCISGKVESLTANGWKTMTDHPE